MFKFIVIPLLVAAVNAGYLGVPAYAPSLLAAPAYASPYAVAHAPIAVAHAPVVAAPTIVKTVAPVATSYSNTYKVSSPIVAPAVIKTPVAVAAPAYGYAAAPAYGYGGLIHG